MSIIYIDIEYIDTIYVHSVARKITAMLSVAIATLFPSFSFIYNEQDITVEILSFAHFWEEREGNNTRETDKKQWPDGAYRYANKCVAFLLCFFVFHSSRTQWAAVLDLT